MNGGEQVLSDGSFGQRQQLGFIEAGLRALRFRVELADGVDLVAEKLDAHGPVGFRRVHIEDAAAAGELAGHFDQVHLRVADAGEVAGKDFNVEFFAAPHGDGKAGIVVAIEKTERGSFCGRDENGHGAGGEFEKRGGALLLHVGVGREIFEWEHIVGGQAHDAAGIDGAGEIATGAKRGFQSFGGLVVGDDDDDGLLGGASKKRNVEGAGGVGESGHTSATDTKARGACERDQRRRTAPVPQIFRGQTGGSCGFQFT